MMTQAMLLASVVGLLVWAALFRLVRKVVRR